MLQCRIIVICSMITLVFTNNNGSRVATVDMIPDGVLKEQILHIACKNKCSTNNVTTGICECNSIDKLDIQPLLASNKTLESHCKESDKVVLKTCSTNKEENAFLVEVQNTNEDFWTFLNLTNSCFPIIDKLLSNQEYKFRIWTVSKNGTIYEPLESPSITTKSLNDKPLPVTGIDLLWYEYSWSESDYRATLSWNASTDKSCHHEFVWFDGNDATQLEVEIPYNFTITIGKLGFDSNYSLAVMTKNSNWSLESEKVWYHFTTPRCLDVLKSLEFCAPERPTGIEAQEELRSSTEHSQVYDVKVTWDHPLVVPDSYVVHLNTFLADQDDVKSSVNVSGNLTNVVFEEVSLYLHYQIMIVAHSKGGRSEPFEFYKQINTTNMVTSSLHIGNNVFMLFILPFLVILCVVSSLIFGYKQFYKREKLNKRKKYFEELELKSTYIDVQMSEETEVEKFEEDEWEINDSCLSLSNKVLGKGAFGLVRKGYMKRDDKIIEVAVKMLLDHCRYSDMRDFKQEIEIMKSVGSHPHIVSLIGCRTKGRPGDLRLIVEYCARGDLLTYLRDTWDEISNRSSATQYQNTYATDCNNIDNKLYLMGVTETWNMQIKDLVSIGLQVSMGMEYLASLHVLHRDLAARNVLVCEDRSVKVSDFGLSRDVYRDDVYCKTSSGKLPIRWLALESLSHQIYTTHSDVWSYGILLWEIVTLGGNPYPGIHTHELLEMLLKGYRMSRPSNCSPELYAIMKSCWDSNIKERPSFTQIRQLLENILECKSEYLSLNLHQSFETLDATKESDMTMTSVSSERYVKTFAS